MGEGGVEAERDHDRRAVGYADRRRERSERLSQPLLCPFSLIRRQRPLGSVRRGKVARYKGKQAIPPLVVPPCAEAVPPQSGGTTGACFTCCNGVWVIPRNELARHRGTTLRQQPRHRGDEPSERRFGTPVHHPVWWSHCVIRAEPDDSSDRPICAVRAEA